MTSYSLSLWVSLVFVAASRLLETFIVIHLCNLIGCSVEFLRQGLHQWERWRSQVEQQASCRCSIADTVVVARLSLKLGRLEGRIVLAAVAVVQTLRLRLRIASPGPPVGRTLLLAARCERLQTGSIIRGDLYSSHSCYYFSYCLHLRDVSRDSTVHIVVTEDWKLQETATKKSVSDSSSAC